jgi:hypothetical protein
MVAPAGAGRKSYHPALRADLSPMGRGGVRYDTWPAIELCALNSRHWREMPLPVAAKPLIAVTPT